jgi:hypothetical protein
VTDIFQEVEEEVRRERYQQLWKKYGNVAIALAALIVIAAAGYQLWQAWDRTQREAASNQFHAAEQLAQAGRLGEAETAFAKLAEGAPSGYATLAKFHQAAVMLAAGKRDQALALYGQLTQLKDPNLSGMARLRIAWAQAEYTPRDQIEKTLAPLRGADSSWRFSAQEVLAYTDLREGRLGVAMKSYEQLAADRKAPQGVRDRAGAIAEYLKANPSSSAAMPSHP